MDPMHHHMHGGLKRSGEGWAVARGLNGTKAVDVDTLAKAGSGPY